MEFPNTDQIREIELFINFVAVKYDSFSFYEVMKVEFPNLIHQDKWEPLYKNLLRLRLIEPNIINHPSYGKQNEGERLTDRAYDIYYAGGWNNYRDRERQEKILRDLIIKQGDELRRSTISANNTSGRIGWLSIRLSALTLVAIGIQAITNIISCNNKPTNQCLIISPSNIQHTEPSSIKPFDLPHAFPDTTKRDSL
ncbi:MAG TPA: hypothetical protein VFW78_01275 [Bacteroidia bacterium]|nr:hypothetical protein [Bacteroidia bacterium]